MVSTRAAFSWNDPLHLDDQLADDERMIRDAAASFAAAELQPRIEEAHPHEVTDPGLFRQQRRRGHCGSAGRSPRPMHRARGLPGLRTPIRFSRSPLSLDHAAPLLGRSGWTFGASYHVDSALS